MIMIVSLHYFVFNGINNYSNLNNHFGKLIIALTYCSVDIFVLISGWFYKKEPIVDFKKTSINQLCYTYYFQKIG